MSEQKELSVMLEEIEERANKATPMPWFTDPTGDTGDWLVGTSETPVADCDLGNEFGKQILDNATFIASARTDVPRLVKALRRARERFLVYMGPETQCEVIQFDADITAILNGEEEKKDSGEPGAV